MGSFPNKPRSWRNFTPLRGFCTKLHKMQQNRVTNYDVTTTLFYKHNTAATSVSKKAPPCTIYLMVSVVNKWSNILKGWKKRYMHCIECELKYFWWQVIRCHSAPLTVSCHVPWFPCAVAGSQTVRGHQLQSSVMFGYCSTCLQHWG